MPADDPLRDLAEQVQSLGQDMGTHAAATSHAMARLDVLCSTMDALLSLAAADELTQLRVELYLGQLQIDALVFNTNAVYLESLRAEVLRVQVLLAQQEVRRETHALH